MSKNIYTDKLDDIVNKQNNAYYITIKMNPVDIKSSTYIDFDKKILIKKVLNLKSVILLEYQNIKNTFVKGYTPNWSEEVIIIKEIKNTKLLELFKKKNCKKQIKKNLELKK